MLLSLLQYPLNSFYILLFLALGIDENVIKVYNNKNIEFLCQDLINIALKSSRCVS